MENLFLFFAIYLFNYKNYNLKNKKFDYFDFYLISKLININLKYIGNNVI